VCDIDLKCSLCFKGASSWKKDWKCDEVDDEGRRKVEESRKREGFLYLRLESVEGERERL
jgi:hypothetical protein